MPDKRARDITSWKMEHSLKKTSTQYLTNQQLQNSQCGDNIALKQDIGTAWIISQWDNIKTCLTTTKDTEIKLIRSQGPALFVLSTSSVTEVCEIIGANITNTYICPLNVDHHFGNLSLSSTKVHCPNCDTHFKSTIIQTKTHGNVTEICGWKSFQSQCHK